MSMSARSERSASPIDATLQTVEMELSDGEIVEVKNGDVIAATLSSSTDRADRTVSPERDTPNTVEMERDDAQVPEIQNGDAIAPTPSSPSKLTDQENSPEGETPNTVEREQDDAQIVEVQNGDAIAPTPSSPTKCTERADSPEAGTAKSKEMQRSDAKDPEDKKEDDVINSAENMIAYDLYEDPLELMSFPIELEAKFPIPPSCVRAFREGIVTAAASAPVDEDTYLELKSSRMSNVEYLTMSSLDGWWSYWRDNTINVVLESIGKTHKCGARGMVILPSFTAGMLYRIGEYGDVDDNNFASYAAEKQMLRGKSFIFIPINDGYGAEEAAADGIAGQHWSLVVINCADGIAHYIDSFMSDYEKWRQTSRQIDVARRVVLGVEHLFDDHLNFNLEVNSPHQYRHNQCVLDPGPCGPFVADMVELYLKEIRIQRRRGEPVQLGLPNHFPQFWRHRFDSGDSRVKYRRSVTILKMKESAATFGEEKVRAWIDGNEGHLPALT